MTLLSKLQSLGLEVHVQRAPKRYYWQFRRWGLHISVDYTGSETVYYMPQTLFGQTAVPTRVAKKFYTSFKHFEKTGECIW